MSETVIRQVTQGIWTFSRPFARFGFIPFGGRSTAIKLASGDVWVLASTPLEPETKETIDKLGPVKYIIGPDAESSHWQPEFQKAYPDAKVIGVQPLIKKKEGVVSFAGAYGADPEGTKYGYEPEVRVYFSGFKNKDVAFLHGPSKTLIQADLLLNLPCNEQPDGAAFKRVLWKLGTDKPCTVAEWDFDRIIPCHGDVIETAYKWFLDGNH
ncbi:hypothetical protein BS47DRAFT_1340919 [Hydnum rufescens UP504]|uniref:Uncharacterized protein n=1 Tax=Hydnum rufescens UP504 TaxID=1448309 RepID=A0A9P6B2R1_9AGAM|nr:hypothetical protein BS47DRAFT_1340919 [Hydnum rufescens UP504]